MLFCIGLPPTLPAPSSLYLTLPYLTLVERLDAGKNFFEKGMGMVPYRDGHADRERRFGDLSMYNIYPRTF